MAWVATQNFASVDRALSTDNPAARLRLKPLGNEARAVLRYQASEQNRYYFANWEMFQLLFGSFFFCVMLFGSREDKFILLGVLIMLLLVLLQRLLLTPEITTLGRMIDFAPSGDTPERKRFWVTHLAYVGVEAAKWLLTLVLAGQMIFSRKRSGRSRDSRRKLDRVDEADYRGVDR